MQAAVVMGSDVLVACIVPLVIGFCVSTRDVVSAASLPDGLRGINKVSPDGSLASVLLTGREAALGAEEVHGWLVSPEAVATLRDVVPDANELHLCVPDGESDPTASAKVLCGSINEPSATIADIAGSGADVGWNASRRNVSRLTSGL